MDNCGEDEPESLVQGFVMQQFTRIAGRKLEPIFVAGRASGFAAPTVQQASQVGGMNHQNGQTRIGLVPTRRAPTFCPCTYPKHNNHSRNLNHLFGSLHASDTMLATVNTKQINQARDQGFAYMG